ncbi:hypothetical protein GFM44_23355 [Rhizobium leguminosarum bv. viciae]|nr:hypothetical protein [Rhizobium leguminosarum bv. viciae]
MTDDHLSRLELGRRQLLAKMESNSKVLDGVRKALGGRRVLRDSKDSTILPEDQPYDLSRGEKTDILWAWADGQLRTTAVCARLDCTPAELIDTAALHEVDFPAGLKLPTYTLREDGPWTTVELLIANGFELVVTGAEDVGWPSDNPAVVDAALRGQDQAVMIIVDNTIPAEGWENVGWIHYRLEGNELVPVDALGGLASVRRILEEVSAALDLDEDDDGIEPPSTSFKP